MLIPPLILRYPTLTLTLLKPSSLPFPLCLSGLPIVNIDTSLLTSLTDPVWVFWYVETQLLIIRLHIAQRRYREGRIASLALAKLLTTSTLNYMEASLRRQAVEVISLVSTTNMILSVIFFHFLSHPSSLPFHVMLCNVAVLPCHAPIGLV